MRNAASRSTVDVPRTLPELLEGGLIRTVYQPIVELSSDEPVAYEALVRGPPDSSLESPARLFSEASRTGLEQELDRAARHIAIAGAVEARMPDSVSLFVNVEPSTLHHGGPLLAREHLNARSGPRVFVEFTERDLTLHPGSVLRAVQWLRARGCGIALDDIGVDRRSLALLPFLAPDVLKLDMSLVQAKRLDRGAAHVVNAVISEAERSDALVLAEGVETDAHLTRAQSIGATHAQGWFFGRPEELPTPVPPCRSQVAVRAHPTPPASKTPFEVLASSISPRRGDKRILLDLTRHLEAEAETLGRESVVLATFQREGFFTSGAREHYASIASKAALVGVLGVNMEAEPASGVRGGHVPIDDPLSDEWCVVVVSPHFAVSLAARPIEGTRDGSGPMYEFCLSHRRELVLDAARIVLDRLVPSTRLPAASAILT